VSDASTVSFSSPGELVVGLHLVLLDKVARIIDKAAAAGEG